MVFSILRFCSHLLFIYISHQLVVSLVDWSKWMVVTEKDQTKIRLLTLFLSITIGYTVSTFFLDLISIGTVLKELLKN